MVVLNISMVFIALAGLYQKLLSKKLLVTFHDLKRPWRHSEGSLVAILRLRVLSLSECDPMFESVSNGFLPKEAPFIFIPLTYNGEVAKLT